jgi:hypothetical protein
LGPVDRGYQRRQVEAIKAGLAEKKGIRRIARELQTGVGTVLRIKAERRGNAC